MATRSTISVEYPDQSIKQIYCHFDGYLSNNGMLLLEHYQDPEKINQLMNLGDLSGLGADIGEKQDFNNPNPNWCLSYKRDRGEEEVDARMYSSFIQFTLQCIKEQYNYFFAGGKWYLYNPEDYSLTLLTREMCEND